MSFLGFGGGSESNIIIPEGEKPRAFQTVIPQKSYKDLAESMGRTETEYNRLLDSRYDMTGTSAAIGAQQRGIEMQEAADYASSLPASKSPDQSFRGTPREFDIKSKGNTFETAAGQSPKVVGKPLLTSGSTGQVGPNKTLAQQAAETRYGDAKDYYLAAVEKAKKTPRSYMTPTKDPGFAQNDPSIYLPKNPPKEEKK
tara:strand:- start:335 stop:931 length:597 start_codon:yes stop_codon:yes gene_type:complete